MGGRRTQDSPIFIVGPPRSGTTTMRLALNSHPRIAVPEESAFFSDFWRRKNRWEWTKIVDAFIDRCARFLLPPIDLTEEAVYLRQLNEPDYGLLLSLPLQSWAHIMGKERWGEKTPNHIFYADAIVDLFPNARTVVMMRDPRSTVASMNAYLFLTNDTTFNAKVWRDAGTIGRRQVQRHVPAGQRLDVKYEDLILDPQRVLEKVCSFIGEDFHPDMLSFYKTSADYADTTGSSRLHEPISGDPEAWRTRLTEKQVAIIEAVCRRPMKEQGYHRSGRALHPVEAGTVMAKLAYVGARKLQHRSDRGHIIKYPLFGGRLSWLGRALDRAPGP